MKKYLLLFIISSSFVTPVFSQGINAYFMKDQPISEFSKRDIELFKASALDVLENKQENETLSWENPETGTKGKIKLLESSTYYGHSCKTVRLQNRTKNIVGTAHTFKACKQEDTWQVVPLYSD